MSVTELYQISLATSGHFMSSGFMNLPVNNLINDVPRSAIHAFFDHTVTTPSQLRSFYLDHAQYNINWAYTRNLLRDRPLVRVGDRLICPIPSFLIRRITSGLYYDLIRRGDNLGRYFGPAFQNLVGEILNFQCGQEMELLDERRYKTAKGGKDTIDWIVSDKTGHLFIECKGSRTRFRGISDLSDQEVIASELRRVGEFGFQAYKSLDDALQGKYPHWKPDDRPLYVMIVTLEDWHAIGVHIESLIINPIRQRLIAAGIDPNLLEKFPISFAGIDDFEAALCVAKEVGIDALFKPKSAGEYLQWSVGTYLRQEFPSVLERDPERAFANEWDLLGGRPKRMAGARAALHPH